MPEDDPIVLDEIITRFRERFPQLDEAVENQDIFTADAIATEMRIAERDSEAYLHGLAHLAIIEQSDVSAETMGVTIGGISRQYVPLTQRGSDASFWAGTHFGRVYLTLVRGRKGINAQKLTN